MTPDDILNALRKRPFVPFQLQISDGSVYEVHHPELVMVGLGAVVIGVPPEGQHKPVYERLETAALAHVVKLLPLASTVQ